MISKKIRAALEIFYGKHADRLHHVDHIKPRSKGGVNSIENLQVISRRANVQKGDFYVSPRRWQEEFWDAWASHTKQEFLLTAIPAAGKTIAAIKVSRDFLLAGQDRAILIIVPTKNLQEQWRNVACKYGIELQTKEYGTEFRGDFVGAAATYQSLDTFAQIFKNICARYQTLVILDEPHHCAEKESWGINAGEAFNLARRILLLSGTPFRTDYKKIPFITYDGQGYSVADFRYDYPEALTDGVVRTLHFDYSRGSYDWAEDGMIENYEFHSDLSERAASERLSKMLTARGDWVKEQIAKSHDRLLKIRQDIPDAAAMAACIDQMHAEQIARVVRYVTGKDPSIIVSDTDIATDTVGKFRPAKTEWLLSVKQVSEGTDITRLQVLCWLTNVATELFFRQLIGRVSRVRFIKDEVDEEICAQDSTGYVFLPDDPRLIQFARRLEAAQILAYQQEAEKNKRERIRNDDDKPTGFFVASNHAGTAHTFIGAKEYSVDDAEEIRRIADEYSISVEKAAKIYERECRPRTQAYEEGQQSSLFKSKEKSYEEKIIIKRREVNTKTNHLAYILGVHPKEIHNRFKSQAQMDLQELNLKWETLLECIIEKRMP